MLTLDHVSKTFFPGTVNARLALDDLSLHLEKGDFVTVIGSNGAGKSTMLNAIAGAFLVDHGHILLDGQDITFQKDYRRAKQIGRLFQDPLSGTAPSMTIEENLTLAYLRTSKQASPFGLRRSQRSELRDRVADLGLGLEDRMTMRVGLLSGGQRQALTLLMATIVTPKLLLLDEHTAALDPATADTVLNLTKRIVAEHNITCLMITHNMQSSLHLGNRTIMMDAGRIVLDVSGKERDTMTVNDLLARFGKAADNDRMLLG
jgi:putative ABC transport system ATP-binding protein